MKTTADHRATSVAAAETQGIAECLSLLLLQRYIEGGLDDQQSAGIEQHLLNCEHCRSQLADFLPSWDESALERGPNSSPWPGELLRETAAIIDSWPGFSASALTSLPARFTPIRRLGGGGMGEVWEVHDQLLKRQAALKFLRTAAPALHDLRRFQKEAEALARLSHPGIVQVHEVLTDCQTPALLMELISGPSLSEVTQGRALPDAQAARLLAALADAAAHAHDHGVVHRDLKPSNILLRLPRTAKTSADHSPDSILATALPLITDFGVAHLAGDQTLTCAGQLLGTPAYMAPEQACGDRSTITPAADIYSLGAVLYELLTGRPPFVTDDPAATLMLVRTEEPLSPRLLQPRIASDLENICLKCLAKNPADRYLSAAALRDDFQAFLEGRPVTARPLSLFSRVGRWVRRNRLLFSLTSVALVSLLAAAVQSFYYGLEQSRLRTQADLAMQTAREQADRADSRTQLLNAHLTTATRTMDRLFDTLGPPDPRRFSPEQRQRLFAGMIQPFEDYVAWYCPDGVVTPEHMHVALRLAWLRHQVDPSSNSLDALRQIESCIASLNAEQISDPSLQHISIAYFELAADFHKRQGHANAAAERLMKAASILERRLRAVPRDRVEAMSMLRAKAGMLMKAQQNCFACGDFEAAADAAREGCETITEYMQYEGLTGVGIVNYMENARALTEASWRSGQITAARDAVSDAACVLRAAGELPPVERDIAADRLRQMQEILRSEPTNANAADR